MGNETPAAKVAAFKKVFEDHLNKRTSISNINYLPSLCRQLRQEG